MFPTPDIFLARLSWLIDEAARWGPAVPVALVVAIALVEAVVLPRRLWAKGVWLLAVVACGVAAGELLRAWERTSLGMAANQAASQSASQATAQTGALRGIGAELDALAQLLPPPSRGGAANSFDTVDDAIASLSSKIAVLKEQVASLKTGEIGRSVDVETAAKMADYLRQYGAFRVVVSCAPEDMEAYTYANQLVGILKAAGWDSHGPEQTVNVLEGPAIGVSVLMRDPSAPDAAKILLAAFDQFNIPHQPGISADYAVPDSATVELFVAKKP